MRRNGFTLLELLIVIAIVGILLLIGLVFWVSARASAVDGAADVFATKIIAAVTAEITETLDTDLSSIEGDCSGATVDPYVPIAGSAYSVDLPGFNFDTTAGVICEVTVDTAGSVQVDANYLGGNNNVVSVGNAGPATNTVP